MVPSEREGEREREREREGEREGERERESDDGETAWILRYCFILPVFWYSAAS